MPTIENLPIEVTLIIHVDRHVLRFAETGKAAGARYHGADPAEQGYSANSSLEFKIRQQVDECITTARARAEEFLRRAYPDAGDKTP